MNYWLLTIGLLIFSVFGLKFCGDRAQERNLQRQKLLEIERKIEEKKPLPVPVEPELSQARIAELRDVMLRHLPSPVESLVFEQVKEGGNADSVSAEITFRAIAGGKPINAIWWIVQNRSSRAPLSVYERPSGRLIWDVLSN